MKLFTHVDSFPSVFHISQYLHYSLSLVHFLPLSQGMWLWDWTLNYKGNQFHFNQFFIPLSHMSLAQSNGIILEPQATCIQGVKFLWVSLLFLIKNSQIVVIFISSLLWRYPVTNFYWFFQSFYPLVLLSIIFILQGVMTILFPVYIWLAMFDFSASSLFMLLHHFFQGWGWGASPLLCIPCYYCRQWNTLMYSVIFPSQWSVSNFLNHLQNLISGNFDEQVHSIQFHLSEENKNQELCVFYPIQLWQGLHSQFKCGETLKGCMILKSNMADNIWKEKCVHQPI